MTRKFFAQENWRKYLIDFAMIALAVLPGYGWGNALRGWMVSKACERSGANLRVAQLVKIYSPRNLRLGSDVYLGHNCYVGNGPIVIGDEAVIGAQAILSGANHRHQAGSVRWSGSDYAQLVIGKGVWVGARAIILSGVTVGDGSIVAAGAVVTKSVRPNVLVAGVPAREIRQIE